MIQLLYLFLLGVLAPIVGAQTSDRGTIRSPANGTHVVPDSWVDFRYASMGEYSVTSYNISIWLFTADPSVGLFTGQATGVSLGQFAFSSSTHTNPSLPAPPTKIYIPNFSKGVSGFSDGWGAGQNQSDATLYLSVFEEWGGKGTSFGARIAYATNMLVYNSTSVA